MTRRTRILIQGAGRELLSMLDLVAESPNFEVIGWTDCGAIADQLAQRFPHARDLAGSGPPEMHEDCAALVGYGEDSARHEVQLRELARDGIPLILIQPPCEAIFAMELDMIQRDTGAPLIPVYKESLHPAVHWLAEAMRTQPALREIEQISIERTASDRSDQQVLRWLAKDALLFRQLMGDFQQVGGMQSSDDAGLSNLSVHLKGRIDAIGRWSIGPAVDAPGAVLSIVSNACRLSITMPEQGPWRFHSSVEMDPPPLEFDADAAIQREILAGLRGETTTPSWEDALRSMDLADVASESVRRRKTLPIRNERLTEEDTFKGMMAAGGCLIMLVLPLLLLAMSLVDALNIPLTKQVTLRATSGQSTVYLPSDASKLDQVMLANRQLISHPSVDALREAFPSRETGRPQGYAVTTGQLYLRPVPDNAYDIVLGYRGTFSLTAWWFVLLLVPMSIFLCLQLLKLVFPQPSEGSDQAESGETAADEIDVRDESP